MKIQRYEIAGHNFLLKSDNGNLCEWDEVERELKRKEKVFEEFLQDKVVLDELRDFWRKRFLGK